MANETLTALGPLFGPNFITVQVNDETGKPFQLEVFPDANNPLLKANGLPMHYYFMPQRVYLAKKQDSPQDFDFGAMIFKGLMTTEDTLGITNAMTESGSLAEGGGVCTFSTTFAIPESVIQGAIRQLKDRSYQAPSNFGLFARFFQIERNDPTPELGIVPILENDVTVEVPRLDKVGSALAPMYIDAQGSGKGSIEATSISSFLITLNQLAAGAIIGMLKDGKSPFTVHYNLKQLFYINACDIHIDIDVDKVFDQFSVAGSAGFLGIVSANLQANYQSCITSGGIKTIIKMQGSDVPDDLKKMIDTQVQDMQTRAFNLVKSEIFDWQPQPDPPATADRGFFSSLFGGASVSLKTNHQKKGIHLTQDFQIDTTVSKLDTVSGDLNDLGPAIRANLDNYLAIVDIGEYFKKLQVAATNNLNWSEKLADGTDLADPIISAQVEVAYPDYDHSFVGNQVNFQTKAQGFHYTTGHGDSKASSELAAWTKDNPRDIINIAFLRLDKPIPQWDTNKVKLRKTIVFNSDDPRVELSGDTSTFSREIVTMDHAPVITRDEVGYLFVKFVLIQKIPNDLFAITLTCKIKDRTDTIVVTKFNQNGVVWEIFSDKYMDVTSATYSVQLIVAGPNFTDPIVTLTSPAPLSIALPTGRNKYVSKVSIILPLANVADLATINQYIKAAAAASA